MRQCLEAACGREPMKGNPFLLLMGQRRHVGRIVADEHCGGHCQICGQGRLNRDMEAVAKGGQVRHARVEVGARLDRDRHWLSLVGLGRDGDSAGRKLRVSYHRDSAAHPQSDQASGAWIGATWIVAQRPVFDSELNLQRETILAGNKLPGVDIPDPPPVGDRVNVGITKSFGTHQDPDAVVHIRRNRDRPLRVKMAWGGVLRAHVLIIVGANVVGVATVRTVELHHVSGGAEGELGGVAACPARRAGRHSGLGRRGA